MSGCGGDCLTLGGCGDGAASSSSAAGGTSATEIYRMTGVGDMVFRLPSTVSVIQIEARYDGTISNFIVLVAGDLKVNEIIGTQRVSTTYSGRVTVTPGGLVEITNSAGVAWSITEVRL